MKYIEYFRTMFNQIDPCKLAEIINEANIIVLMTKRIRGRSPYIGINQL
jgi:hypothetical protein